MLNLIVLLILIYFYFADTGTKLCCLDRALVVVVFVSPMFETGFFRFEGEAVCGAKVDPKLVP